MESVALIQCELAACANTIDEIAVARFGIGNIAVVDMPDRIFINASVIAYLLPLILFLAGLVGGHLLFPASETAEILCALGGVAIAAAVIALTEKKRKADPQWTPVIVDIIPVKERKEIDGTDTE